MFTDVVKRLERIEWILGNKGTWPFTFWEQGDVACYFKGTKSTLASKHIYNVITRETPRQFYN